MTNLINCSGGGDNYETGFVGLINQAMTCYLNSLLQTLYMTPEFRNAIYRWQYKPALQSAPLSIEQINASKKNIPYQLQKLFLQMQTTNKKCLSTQDLTQSFGWSSDDAFQQHDVQELCRVMFDALEKMFKGTEQENLITELYQGKIKDYVKCVECNTESARVDVFLDIQLSIKSYIDEFNYNLYDSIEKALSSYIEPEILDGNNKYYCEKCKKLCKAHKGIIFEQFPYILCLQLKRFDFDYKTMMRIKLNNKVTFPERIDIKPYLDESTCLNNQDLKTEYELFSIMIHSGSSSGGHYYAYVKDFLTEQWYNFNDERVTRLDPNDIKKAYGVSYSSFSSTTAYMLLYRQIDVKRNELFIIKDQYPSHIYDLLKREQVEFEEAEKLKEYLENLCKIKIILVNSDQMENFKPNEILFPEKQCSLHKDLTIEQAKYEIGNEFGLNKSNDEFIKSNTRLVKFDMYNEHIEQSFDNELITIFEALNHMKQVYGYCWLFEVKNNKEEEFVIYKPGSISIKFTEINSYLYKTIDLFLLRVDNDITSMELLMAVNSKLKIVDDNDDKYYDKIIDNIHLAFEKQNAFNSYIYLNDHLNTSLSSLGFLKSNKIFIEYKKIEVDDEVIFNKNKFFYILQTITNLISLTCYLPTQESTIVYKNKIIRRCNIIDKKKLSINTSNRYANENLVPTYEEVMVARGSSINVVGSKTIITSDSAVAEDLFKNKEITFNDDMSTASGSSASGYNKRRNAFIDNNITTYEEDEDELDFGNLTNKVFKQKQQNELDDNISNGMLKRRFSDELSKSVDNIQLKTTKRNDIEDEMSLSSQPISETAAVSSSNSTLNLKDISIDVTNPQQQPFYHHHHHHHGQHIIDMETSLDEGIGSGSSPNNIKNSPSSLDNLHGSSEANLNEIDDLDSVTAVNSSNENKFSIFGSNVEAINDDDVDIVDNLSTDNDHYGPYSQNFNNNNNNNTEEDWDRDAELENLNKKINFNNPSLLISK
jgi:ubiquitin C-terminal hydrolase